MPRGRQRTEEQRLQEFDDQIAAEEAKKVKIDTKIKDLKTQKQAILDTQKAKKLEELQKFINKTGKSPDEIMKLIKKQDSTAEK